MIKDGYSYLLPEGLLTYFDVIGVNDSKHEIQISLDEKNNIDDPVLESKGFCPTVQVNDFPIRGKSLILNIRRRRWINKESNAYVQRDFDIVAEGTRITQEFATFLKGRGR